MMMTHIYSIRMILLCAVMAFAALFSTPSQAQQETIAAIVNDRAVSSSDVNDRMKLVITSSGLPKSQDIFEKLRPQILTALIEEQIKMQEAEKYDLEITQQEIESGFATIAQQNKMQPEQFRDVLQQGGIPVSTLEDQIRSQIAWTKVVQSLLRSQVDISENDVAATLERLKSGIGKAEYRVFEIFLPVNSPKEERDVANLARKLHTELTQRKAPFQKVASQFSQSAGAAKGGDLGWVQEGQLSEEIDKLLSEIPEGKLTDPVRSLSGYHIIFLAQKREISEENMPSEDQIENQLGMQRLDRLQRRYLMDLKAESFVELRS